MDRFWARSPLGFLLGPLFRFLSPRKKRRVKKIQLEIPLLELATIGAKPPPSSTPLYSIPDLNFLNMCDISGISSPEEESSRGIPDLETTPSLERTIPREYSSIVLEKQVAVVAELGLEHLYADRAADWFGELLLDSLEFSSDGLSCHGYF